MPRLEKTAQKKEQLIALAKSNSARPRMSDELGQALNNYTSKASHSYDPDFSNTIRELRPDWFRARKKAVEFDEAAN